MNTSSNTNRILIAPLDWGLGHATRCVPIIKQLIEQGKTPVIAAYGAPLKFYQLEFPELEIIEFPGLEVSYPRKTSLMLKMALTFPMIIWSFIKEHILLRKIIADYKIDIVIADGRYGLWNKNVKSIFINHQINIKLPGMFSMFEFPLYILNRLGMSKFDEIWVPDTDGKTNLAGELSIKYNVSSKFKFVGPLSRFSNHKVTASKFNSDILIIISGPEPARTDFESKVFDQLKNVVDKQIIVVRGKPGDRLNKIDLPKNVSVYNHLDSEDLGNAIANTKLVISRPGYSTVMDLAMLGKKVLFVPTPGQSEQEYLAAYYHNLGWATYLPQQYFAMPDKDESYEDYSGIPKLTGKDMIFHLEQILHS
jgi:uncharacterized protein (TIGR00661 family)